MTEVSAGDIGICQPPADAAARLSDASTDALYLMMGVQTAMLQEMVFASYEILDRTRTEMHLFAEFASKIASAHSVGDYRTMWGECSRHQLDYIRRDTDRLLRHGEQVIETATKLFGSRSRN
jgi:hypothetical protein